MVLITQSGPETLPIGGSGPDFQLPGTDGKTYSLASFKAAKLLTLIFTCNHCPYAKAYDDRLIALAQAYSAKGVVFAAISANDSGTYPEDSFEKMKERAQLLHLPYPYLYDETQGTAKAYGAVCTPHIFVLNQERKLVYEGRVDDNWKDPAAVKSRDLQAAFDALLAGQPVPTPQTNPMGCSIKWKK